MQGLRAFYAAFTDPEAMAKGMPLDTRRDFYSQAWSYYRGQQFSRRNGYDWTLYLNDRELYKHTRLIYNPVPSIVDFYVDNIWQPARNEDFESLVTPLSAKTDEEIIEAVAQLDQWSSFKSESQKIKRYAAATGNVLIEGIDDLERGKVLHKCVWPGYVTGIELNATGDVLSYTLEYPVYDKAIKGIFRYKKIVTKETFSYFRDNQPFIPDGESQTVKVNPYGFCFAVWIRHTDDGADYGLPACNSLDKIDEVNSLGSHLHDNIHKLVESPLLIGAPGEVEPLVGATSNNGIVTPQDPRLNWIVLKADSSKGAVAVHDLASKLKLAEAHPYLKDLLASFTDDYPELQAASIIRENSQLSGAALERMLTPAQNRLDGVQANYNQQLIKLRQMQIAVAGMRTRAGWFSLTDQQQKFADFNLNSYQDGKIDFNLERSLLVHNTPAEDEELLKLKTERAKTLMFAPAASRETGLIDRQEALSIAGYSDDEIEDIAARMLEPQPPPPQVIPEGLPENRQLGEGA